VVEVGVLVEMLQLLLPWLVVVVVVAVAVAVVEELVSIIP
jgi:hypothetical protein